VEIEKGLAGAGGSRSTTNTSDSVTERAMAQLLKFLQDRIDPFSGKEVWFYVLATCNDITKMRPEYLRAERWDTAPFFVDLPNHDEKRAILDHYIDKYKVSSDNKEAMVKAMEGWSGAEIRALCRLSSMMQLKIEQTREFILPISKTMEKEIKSLRDWANGRTLPATLVKTTVEGKKEKTREIEF